VCRARARRLRGRNGRGEESPHSKPITRSSDLRLAALLAVLLLPLPAIAAKLDYDAYVGSARVGAAEVVVEREADAYLIRGSAWAEGLFRWLTEWRSHFEAVGRVVEGTPIAEGYSLTERAKNKVKEISLTEGVLTYVKNGKPRFKAAPPSRLDLLSALFLPNGCDTSNGIHTGKDEYFLRLKSARAVADSSGALLRCEFEVRDEDDQRIDAIVWLGVIQGLTVPVRLELKGALEGTLKLRV
jgi:hypothetical protein